MELSPTDATIQVTTFEHGTVAVSLAIEVRGGSRVGGSVRADFPISLPAENPFSNTITVGYSTFGPTKAFVSAATGVLTPGTFDLLDIETTPEASIFVGDGGEFDRRRGTVSQQGISFILYAELIRPTPDPEPTPGDFNGDDVVDNTDLNLLLVNWGEEEVPPEWVQGFEAPVDNGELNALLVSWGAGATSVPEPATAALLLTAAVAQRRRRRAENR